MPAKLFFELDHDKQARIIDSGISEFSNFGYENSSTNRIVNKSGISKGSLFKYFPNKEDLYFYILDRVTAELIGSLEKELPALSSELFQRVIEYSALEFAWYIQNPEKAKLIIGAFIKSNTEIYRKTVNRYGVKELNIYYQLLENVDFSNFRWDKKTTTDILKWFLKGFNEEFLEQIQDKSDSLEHLQRQYADSLTEYMEVLKKGLLK